MGAVGGVEVETRPGNTRLEFVVVELENNIGTGVEVDAGAKGSSVRAGVVVEPVVGGLGRLRLGKDDELDDGVPGAAAAGRR